MAKSYEEQLREYEAAKERHKAQRAVYNQRRRVEPRPSTQGDIFEMVDEDGAVIALFVRGSKARDRRVKPRLTELLQRYGFERVGQMKSGSASFTFHYSTPLPPEPVEPVTVHRESLREMSRIIEAQRPKGIG